MSSANGISKDEKSYYKSNIIIGDSLAENGKDTKAKLQITNGTSQEDSKKKKKSKKGDDDKDDQKKDDVEPVGFFKMFRYATTKDKLLYALGLLCAVATGLTTPANSLIFGNLSNAMISYGGSGNYTRSAADDDLLDAVQTFALQNSIIGIIMLVCSYISVTSFNYAANGQILRIRGKFLRSVLHQDMAWYDFNQSGEVASRMNEDLSKMEDGIAEKDVMFVHFIVAFIGSLVLAFIKGWELALVCLSSLPVTFIAIGIVGVATSKLSKQELNVYASAGNIAEEALSGVRTVKTFEGEYKEVHAYKSQIVDARKINIKRNLFSGMGFGLLWFFIYASYALAFWYGVGLVLKNYEGLPGYDNYDPGNMITVFFSVMMGSMNIGMASPYIEAFGVAKGACAKVFKLIEQIPTINPIEPKGKNLNKPLVHIELRDVSFKYPTREEVQILHKFNLTIKRGQTIALVGSSGCGKSTIIQLVQRFYDPQEGSVYFNDVDLKDINITWLRERIGVVGQEPILFGTTIYENIRYGREDATKEMIIAAATAANAHIFINKLPKGLDTLVGERGAQLSGGQKQRIAIARALVRNPEILLLDEATSALDTASEAKVQAALEKASKGRTTIIVAHRLSTIRRADRIIVIDKGVVVESGTHAELMDLKSHYYNLVTTQLGDEPFTAGVENSGKDNKFFDTKDEDEEMVEYKIEEAALIEENLDDSALWPILKMNTPEWPQLLGGMVSSVIMGCAMPIFALLFGEILQILAVRDNPEYVRDNTNVYSLYFLITGIVVGLATFLQIYLFGIAGERLTERLRGMMFGTMLKQEVAWFDDKANSTGSLCSRLSGDASAVQGATGQRIGTIIQSVATIVLGVGLSMYYEWSLGLLALAFAPFILVAAVMQRKVMAQENMGTGKAMENCTKLAVEVVSNIRTVASLGREEMFYQQYMDLLHPAMAKAKKNTHFRGLVYGLARSLMFFAFAACMWYGGWCVVNKGMEFGNVFKVSQALIMGTASIANALAFAPNLQKGVTAAKKIYLLFNRVPQIQDKPGISLAPWTAEGDVDFKEVKFSYPTRAEIPVLRGIIMNMKKGQKVALVGSSGCGKSTCIQLLQRFYDVDAGSVTIDSLDLRNLSLSNLRHQLGIVSQEPILFDRSIRENIAYGDNTREVTEQEIIAAAKKANIHNFISALPLGYETRMGEKGTQLSGGQKQRIAIARAMVRNPKILLLDEATSALDAESEKIVQEALDAVSEGRTTISIAHRLSTIIDSDVIYVLDNGQVAECGTHKELLKLHGIYHTLWRLQTGG
ncbi:ATP-dependent translocase ABCB1 isoform X1 [Bactrocera neohumeralis]|uniref:ATP-dependent translocase ABCB1 n=1 Tax=Bactrocera tryoni TaxID=59916 RepID=UPI001A9598EC|nr:ATP-dependent translocase ABCB1 [Bactrocera tryoni]XP_050326010.1 ATP-dependent translocase ABCB1 isoform X1 [Bactrocera neohumeralis]